MKFLILIPSYLWKNTLKRWFENPISPFSKILIPVLLSLLATLILVFFIETEQQLVSQLKAVDSYSVNISERVSQQGYNSITAEKTLIEQWMWKAKYGADNIVYIRQPLVAVTWKKNTRVPVLVYAASEYNQYVKSGGEEPEILFLNSKKMNTESYETLGFNMTTVSARCESMPDFINEHFKVPYVLAIPIEVAHSFLSQGYIVNIRGRFDGFADVKNFVFDAESYYHAERRKVQVISALQILESIENIQKIQYYVRLGVVLSCGIILAMILGTIAWLEFRQESYLMALLRSFGAPSWMLLIHSFFENIILVFIGVAIAFSAWGPIYDLLRNKIKGASLRASEDVVLPL
ncbi:hypothetical protein OAI07_01975, partial [Akkermansiaceae bacterium]|nr:hypothetical protein [Akkermansiaceae bacterium]